MIIRLWIEEIDKSILLLLYKSNHSYEYVYICELIINISLFQVSYVNS